MPKSFGPKAKPINSNNEPKTKMKNQIKTTQLKSTRNLGRRFKATDTLTGISVIINQTDEDVYPDTWSTFSELMHTLAAKRLQIKLENNCEHNDELRGIKVDGETYLWTQHSQMLRCEISNFDIALAKPTLNLIAISGAMNA